MKYTEEQLARMIEAMHAAQNALHYAQDSLRHFNPKGCMASVCFDAWDDIVTALRGAGIELKYKEGVI